MAKQFRIELRKYRSGIVEWRVEAGSSTVAVGYTYGETNTRKRALASARRWLQRSLLESEEVVVVVGHTNGKSDALARRALAGLVRYNTQVVDVAGKE